MHSLGSLPANRLPGIRGRMEHAGVRWDLTAGVTQEIAPRVSLKVATSVEMGNLGP